jgi:Tfp pilus assembly protein PilZ
LQVWFESPEALRNEFEKNIVNGGIFVATDETYQVREAVTVDIELIYAKGTEAALSLDGEVVHVVTTAMAASGAVPGAAVQFEANADRLRELFEPLLGQQAVEEASHDEDREGAGRRGAKRGAVRVPVRVMPTMSPPFEATSRDLSATGILISMRENVLPLGEVVRICLWHPSGDPSVEIDSQVVRQLKNKKGRIAAIAVAFDRGQAAEPRVREVIEALGQAGVRSRLGGISGSLGDLGLANMLQMFGSSAPQGTLVVECDGEQGWVAFADGQLLVAELGALEGQDALMAMLDWGEGQFQFEATVDAKLLDTPGRKPLAGALLAAVCALDERDNEANTVDLREPDTTFEVDADREASDAGALDKTAAAVLDLAKAGLSVGKIGQVVPEPPEAIQSALEGLVELGVLLPR